MCVDDGDVDELLEALELADDQGAVAAGAGEGLRQSPLSAGKIQ